MAYNVIVIGGGPCGSVAAREAALCGMKVLLLDRKKHIGRPVHCTGLLSTRALETTGVSTDSVMN